MTNHSLTIAVHTLGCKVSQYESAVVSAALRRAGYNVSARLCGADAYLVNTCTVTSEADRKCRQAIRRAGAYGIPVFVIGCFSEVARDEVTALPNVVYVSGTARKLAVVSAIEEYFNGIAPRHSSVVPPDADGFEQMTVDSYPRTRAYIKIEDGCGGKCSYCIIPRARGAVRSKTADKVLAEASALILAGCPEIVLTGIELDAWGKDTGDSLTELLRALDAIPGDFGIRLGSLDPSFITPAFVSEISVLKKLCPHFHLSLQSGSGKVLAAMRRRYNAAQAKEAVTLLRSMIPGTQLTCDVIVGFPGETEQDFEETCRFARFAGFLYMHIFPYSARSGTPAAEMSEQIDAKTKKERAACLGVIRDELRNNACLEASKTRSVKRVLIEQPSNDGFLGHSPDYIEFFVQGEGLRRGERVDVTVTRVENGICFAVPVAK